MKRKFKKWW